MKPETLDSIGTTGMKVSVLGAGTAGAGLWTASEVAAIVGALVAIAGLIITWYYKRKANRRLEAEHLLRQQERQMRMDLMRATGQPHTACETRTDFGALELQE
ncbi:holin [Delftia sp. GW456-R20]|nr:holin [Delftia sp. GW456-R20]KZK31994.1 holin [Delftia sp. GW456-R20]